MVSTPCIKLCRIEGEHCIGCARHIDEIRMWSTYSEEKRKEIMSMTVYKTKYGTYSTLELAASSLGISIERAEKMIMRGESAIKLVTTR